MKRYALITLSRSDDSIETVKRYLPGNYRVIYSERHAEWSSDRQWTSVVIAGRDNSGWTLDGYVLPRLASGLIHGHEIDLSHEIMKRVPEAPRFRVGELVVSEPGQYMGFVTRQDNEEAEVLSYTWTGAPGELRTFYPEDLRLADDSEAEGFQEMYLKRPEGVPESAVWMKVGYSEVCMHMRVAGLRMWVEPLGDQAAQLYDFQGRKFSAPILRWEAGIRGEVQS